MGTKLIQGGEDHGLRLIAGRIDVSGGTPSVGRGTGFTVVDTAPGQVQVVFDLPGKRIMSASALPIEGTDATGYSMKVDAKVEASSIVFAVYVADATDGALVDNVSFYFMVLLSDVNV